MWGAGFLLLDCSEREDGSHVHLQPHPERQTHAGSVAGEEQGENNERVDILKRSEEWWTRLGSRLKYPWSREKAEQLFINCSTRAPETTSWAQYKQYLMYYSTTVYNFMSHFPPMWISPVEFSVQGHFSCRGSSPWGGSRTLYWSSCILSFQIAQWYWNPPPPNRNRRRNNSIIMDSG